MRKPPAASFEGAAVLTVDERRERCDMANGNGFSEALGAWLEEKEIAHACVRDRHFTFVLNGSGPRFLLFDAAIDLIGDVLWAQFAFPVCAHEDEMLDTKFALSRINGALNTGSVRRNQWTGTLVWHVGVQASAPETVKELLDWLTESARRVIGGYTDYLCHILMNGWEEEQELPEVELNRPAFRFLSPDELERLSGADGAEDDGDEEADLPDDDEIRVFSRLTDSSDLSDPNYIRFERYARTCRYAAEGNGMNRLAWHPFLHSRMDRFRLQILSQNGVTTVIGRMPIGVTDEQRLPVLQLLDGLNTRLRYGMMRLSSKDGAVCYWLRTHMKEEGREQRLLPVQAARELLKECADAVLRAMFDRNVSVGVLISLCEEAVGELNGKCDEAGVREYMP